LILIPVMIQLSECYRTLGVRPGADPEEVRAAHRDLVRVWHPDRFAHDSELQRRAERKLQEINAAWKVLDAFWSRKASARPRIASPPSPTPRSRKPRVRPNRIANALLVLGGSLLALMVLAWLAVGDSGPNTGKPARPLPTVGGALVDQLSWVGDETAALGPPRDSGPVEQPAAEPGRAGRDDLFEQPGSSGRDAGIISWTVHDEADPSAAPQPTASPASDGDPAAIPGLADRLRGLTEDQKKKVAAACAISYRRGPEALDRCVSYQLSRLRGKTAGR